MNNAERRGVHCGESVDRWAMGQVETYLLCFAVVDFVVAAVCCDELGARD